jgi:hypothetical protein
MTVIFGIEIRLRDGQSRNRGPILSRGKNCLFPVASRRVLCPLSLFIRWAPGVLSSWAKRPECEAAHSLATSTEVKDYVFRACCLLNNRTYLLYFTCSWRCCTCVRLESWENLRKASQVRRCPRRDSKWTHHDCKSERFCLSQLARWKRNSMQIIN